jgi:molybdopterin converting factor subunit 1
MNLTVLLFASWRDALGSSTLEVTLPPGATVGDLLSVVQSRAGASELPKPLVAVNHRYAKPHETLASGDEVAIIPPVAGG